MIVHGKHYIVANPVTGEIRQLFPTRDEGLQYLQLQSSPGEALVRRQPGQPDQLVAKRPDDVNAMARSRDRQSATRGWKKETDRQRLGQVSGSVAGTIRA